MPECNPNDCPVNARVDSLEREFDRYRENSSSTHKEMFQRLGTLEQDRATLKTELEGMDEKLDEISSTVKDLAGKPSKRWETLVGCLISALVGAFFVWLASGMPGVGK